MSFKKWSDDRSKPVNGDEPSKDEVVDTEPTPTPLPPEKTAF